MVISSKGVEVHEIVEKLKNVWELNMTEIRHTLAEVRERERDRETERETERDRDRERTNTLH